MILTNAVGDLRHTVPAGDMPRVNGRQSREIAV